MDQKKSDENSEERTLDLVQVKELALDQGREWQGLDPFPAHEHKWDKKQVMDFVFCKICNIMLSRRDLYLNPSIVERYKIP